MEALVTLLLTGVILGLLGSLVITLGSALRSTVGLSEEVEAARVGRTLIDRVASSGGVLFEAGGPGEVRVRLPIGWAEACDSLFVWRGIRTPQANRDSAIVLDSLARRHRVAVAGTAQGHCPGPLGDRGGGRLITFDPVVSGPLVARVYESGVVRVDDAVRYARLSTPRQPLTAPSLDPDASSVELLHDDLRLRLESIGRRVWGRTWLVR